MRRMQGWAGWVAYNDEPPASSDASGTKFGHCKGILAWRSDRIAWLVHSVPLWPDSLGEEALPPLVSSGLRCGQSFIVLSLPRSEALLRGICGALRGMPEAGQGAAGVACWWLPAARPPPLLPASRPACLHLLHPAT